MGYFVIPFSVKIDDVRQVLGSKDASWLPKFQQAECYATYADQYPNFDAILHELIFDYKKPENRKKVRDKKFLFWGGKERNEDCGLRLFEPHEYGYALIVICDTLGKNLTDYQDIFCASCDDWTIVNNILTDYQFPLTLDRMWEEHNIFDLPQIPDFPAISYYSLQEISSMLTLIEQIDKDTEANNDVREILTYFQNGLQLCQDRQTEWVSFVH